jgi:hypothetical protein
MSGALVVLSTNGRKETMQTDTEADAFMREHVIVIPVGAPKPTMTAAQEATLRRLCDGYKVTFDTADYHPQFDLPTGYVAGWIGGRPGTIYVGVDVVGNASS